MVIVSTFVKILAICSIAVFAQQTQDSAQSNDQSIEMIDPVLGIYGTVDIMSTKESFQNIANQYRPESCDDSFKPALYQVLTNSSYSLYLERCIVTGITRAGQLNSASDSTQTAQPNNTQVYDNPMIKEFAMAQMSKIVSMLGYQRASARSLPVSAAGVAAPYTIQYTQTSEIHFEGVCPILQYRVDQKWEAYLALHGQFSQTLVVTALIQELPIVITLNRAQVTVGVINVQVSSSAQVALHTN